MTVHAPSLHFLTEDEQLYFLHIQKTAGTTFTAALDDRFPTQEICPAIIGPELFQLPIESLKNYTLFRGHFGYNLVSILPRKSVVITILRDPVERVLSNIDHIRRYPDHKNHDLLQSGDLITFLKDESSWAEMRNLQTRMVAPPGTEFVIYEECWSTFRGDGICGSC
jgi:hypothetical protein